MNDWNEYNPHGLKPAILCQRFDNKTNRFYHFIKDKIRHTAAGITTWLDAVTPEAKEVTSWKLKYGVDWRVVLNLTADYGTVLHRVIAHIIKTGDMPPQDVFDVAIDILKRLRKYDSRVKENTIYKDVIAFKKFQEDYNLKPLLVEAVLACQSETGEYYAMTVDLPCEITDTIKTKKQVQIGTFVKGKNKGLPKYRTDTVTEIATKTILIDFKSNVFSKEEKSFYDSHLFQLLGAQKAMRQNFDIDCTELYNWSPNAYRTNPSYTFYKWNVQESDIQRFNLLERLASLSGYFKPKGKIEIFDLTAKKADEMLKQLTYEEFVEYEENRKASEEKPEKESQRVDFDVHV